MTGQLFAKVAGRASTERRKNAVRPRLHSKELIGMSQCGRNPLSAYRKQSTYGPENSLSRSIPYGPELIGQNAPYLRWV
jgi:hypothetical protein